MTLVPSELRQAIRVCLSQLRASGELAGVASAPAFEVLLRQIFDSVRRVEYFFALQVREIDPCRSDPSSTDFDPIRAAIQHVRARDLDEAAWLAFLATHFGAHRSGGWKLVREVYGSLGTKLTWDWKTVLKDPERLSAWLSKNHTRLTGKFGNHRKYMSLRPDTRAGTSQAIESYAHWVQPHGSHVGLLAAFEARVGPDRFLLFDALYRDMHKRVKGFGRTGCFDFLCTLGKLGVLPVEPGTPYISGSTGPRAGATQLLGEATKNLPPKELERKLIPLGQKLAGAGVRFAMQVLEDAICNWQKHPTQYKKFYG